MRVAIISDLHFTHWHSQRGLLWQGLVDGIRRAIEREQPDLLIDAGDSECDVESVLRVGVPVLSIKGNHDWYGKSFDGVKKHNGGLLRGTVAYCRGDFFAAGCTLWTDFNDGDPDTMGIAERVMADYRFIDGFSAEACLNEHLLERAWLAEYTNPDIYSPDVVFTHHAPSLRSCHPRYRFPGDRRDLVNYAFASDLDGLVESIGPKLWVHGHVHDVVDYQIGDTRVVANPCGYPSERRGKPPYEPLFVDI